MLTKSSPVSSTLYICATALAFSLKTDIYLSYSLSFITSSSVAVVITISPLGRVLAALMSLVLILLFLIYWLTFSASTRGSFAIFALEASLSFILTIISVFLLYSMGRICIPPMEEEGDEYVNWLSRSLLATPAYNDVVAALLVI